VKLRDGRVLTCPSGSEPTVYVQEATFAPLLTTQGTQMEKRTYTIALSGRVVNETDAAVAVRGLRFTVANKPWTPHVALPALLAAGDAAPFQARATFRSSRRQSVRVGAHFNWAWEDQGLRPCGDKGLIEDD